jgi:hypothetical protein
VVGRPVPAPGGVLTRARQPKLAAIGTRIAVRAFAPRTRPPTERRDLGPTDLVLVLDTETRTDAAQALLFGSYQVWRGGRLRQEGLFHGDVTPAEMAVVDRYVREHASATGGHLRLLTREEFVRRVFLPLAAVAGARVVGFNLPFDLSRIACGWVAARNGGFTLWLLESVDAEGRRWPDRFKPMIRIKALDSRRNFISFAPSPELDPRYRDGKFVRRGRFLDLRTLSYTFTDRKLSLDGAAAEFGLEVRKAHVEEHGVLTAEYIDYNRQDVTVTWQLHQALISEWEQHPIDLAPEEGYSPAAISKAYLRAMGVTPPSERSTVPVERLGQAMTA